MNLKARLLLPTLAASALASIANATPPPPANLTPAGLAWVNAYEALDHKEVGFCFYMKRRYAPPPGITGTFLSEPCRHFLPPTNQYAISTAKLPSPLPPFTSLPLADQTPLRTWLLATLNTPVESQDAYSDFDIRRNPEFTPIENRIAASNSQMTSYAVKQEARSRQFEHVNNVVAPPPQHMGFPTKRLILLLAILGGIYYGLQRRKGKDAPTLPLAATIGLGVVAVLLGLNVLKAALISSRDMGVGAIAIVAPLVFFSPFIFIFSFMFSEGSRNVATKRAVALARKNGYTSRPWNNPYVDNPWEHLIASKAPNVMKDFADAPFIRERAAMPRFRLFWNRNHHNREQSEIGWIWAETLDGNPTVGNPPPEQMRTFLQWPTKVKGKHRMTLWEITPETAASLNDGPLHMGKIAVREYPSGQVMELEHWVGNMEGKVVKRPVPPPTDAHGTADPVGLRNMDPAPDPHGSAQAGGLGDMHLS